MIHWIIGAAGTGKTTAVLKRASQLARAGKKVLLLVPEQYSFDMEKTVRQSLDAASSLRVEVYSFTRLCDRIFRELGGGAAQTVGEASRYLAMSLVLDQMKDLLKRYRKGGQSAAQIMALTRQMEEFRSGGIFPDQMWEISDRMEAGDFAEKMEELTRIYEIYDSFLSRNFGEKGTVEQNALERLRGNPIFADYDVFVDSFKGFMAAEFDLLEQLMQTAGNITFSITTDRLFDDTQGGGIFAPSCQTIGRIMELGRKNAVPIEKPTILLNPLRFASPNLAILEHSLFRDEKTCGSDPNEIQLISCKDPYEEIEWIGAKITQLVRTGQCRYQDIVLIGRDLDSYIQPIHARFADYEIPFFMDERFDVMAQPFTAVILYALEAVKSHYRSEALFSLLKTDLLPFSMEEVALLEEYTYVWDISGAQWEEPFLLNPAGFGKIGVQEQQRLDEIESLRQRLMAPLKTLSKKIQNCTGKALVTALYAFLLEGGVLEALKTQDARDDFVRRDDTRALFDQIMDLWDQYAQVLGETPYPVGRHCELMRLTLSTADVGQIPQALDVVTIGTADRIRPNRPQFVFLIGANEDIFPATAMREGILSEHEREKLSEAGLSLTQPFQMRVLEERFFAYTAMTAASRGLLVSWSNETVEGAPLSPSVLVREIEEIFPGIPCGKALEEDPLFYAVNEKTALGQFGRMSEKATPQGAAFGAFLQESSLKRSYMRMIHPVHPQTYHLESSQTAQTLFGGTMRVSPSKVDRFHQCRFAYFCERGLGVKKPRKAQLSPMESGTIIHYVLQQITTKYPGKALCGLSEGDCRREVRGALDAYLQESMGGEPDKTSRFKYLFTRMSNILVRLIRHLAMEFAVCDFEPVAFELPIAKESAVTPMELQTADGAHVYVEGIVDRVDVMEKRGRRYVRVVDYKTGTKNFDFTDIYYGINLQMLVYLFSICQNGQGDLENVVPAGVLYMPGKMNFLPADRHTDAATMEKEQKKALRMNGLILSDPTVLEGMEADGAGVFIPARLKDGEIDAKSSVASLEELGKLKRHVESLLCKMAQTLQSGDIPALPLEEENFDLCQWCDYRSICGREEEDPKRAKEPLSREAFFEKIGGEEIG